MGRVVFEVKKLELLLPLSRNITKSIELYTTSRIVLSPQWCHFLDSVYEAALLQFGMGGGEVSMRNELT